MKVLFFGSDNFSLPLIKLIDKKHDLAAIITQPDRPKGRGKKKKANLVAQWGKLHNKLIFFDMSDTRIEEIGFDIGVVAAYGNIIPERLINMPRYQLINLHPSLLPRYRGATPVESALLNGDQKTGVSIISVDKKLDSGDILAMKEYPLSGRENSVQLRKILSEIGAELTIEVMENIGNIIPVKQDNNTAVYSKKINKESCRISFTDETAVEIDRKIRAYLSIGSFFKLDGLRIIVENAEYNEANTEKPAGSIIDMDTGLSIQTKDGILKIREIKPEGKRSMSIKQFLNGHKITQKILT